MLEKRTILAHRIFVELAVAVSRNLLPMTPLEMAFERRPDDSHALVYDFGSPVFFHDTLLSKSPYKV